MKFLNHLYLQIYVNAKFNFLHADRRQKKKDTETLYFGVVSQSQSYFKMSSIKYY